MISTILAQQRIKHLASRIKQRDIDFDIEFLFLLASKDTVDTAHILETKIIDGIKCALILVVRMIETDDNGIEAFPETVFYRRMSQDFSAKALKVQRVTNL